MSIFFGSKNNSSRDPLYLHSILLSNIVIITSHFRILICWGYAPIIKIESCDRLEHKNFSTLGKRSNRLHRMLLSCLTDDYAITFSEYVSCSEQAYCRLHCQFYVYSPDSPGKHIDHLTLLSGSSRC